MTTVLAKESFNKTTSSEIRIADVKKTIWLTRPEIQELCKGDKCRFDWWLFLNGAKEYKALEGADVKLLAPDLGEPVAEARPDVYPRFSVFMKLTWEMRTDLQEKFDIETKEGQQGFVDWLLVHGPAETPDLEAVIERFCGDFISKPCGKSITGTDFPLTEYMYLVWKERPDLQETFDINTVKGQNDFIWWYFIYGRVELGLNLFITDDQIAFLNEPVPNAPRTEFLPITRFMAALWLRREDLQNAFQLATSEGRQRFLEWYFFKGSQEFPISGLVDKKQASALCSSDPSVPIVSRILVLMWRENPDLQREFPDVTDKRFLEWVKTNGVARCPLLGRLFELGELQDARLGQAAAILQPKQLEFGVNLIGYARGQLGIGEDVRMAALALQAAEIPFSIYNIEPGVEVDQGENGFDGYISDNLPYSINLICTTGIETARLAAVHGARLFDGRYTIGYWPWELPEWPEEWRHAYDLVDEVWASSRYTFNAYASSSPKPVRHMSMAVTVDATAGLTRADFGLPEDRFLFVFSFDFLSSLARKNPEACVKAFYEAFPRGDEPVGLVVKAMRGTASNPLWQELVDAAKNDGRINIINKTLDRAKVLDLYRACDCFISLHRSEGFGRGIAEAMMLGKPVITTGHSGNMDFTLPGTAGVVEHRPRRVTEDDYPFGGGQTWAEPNVGNAAAWMRRIADDRVLRDSLAQSGKQLTTNIYAPAVVGETYALVLRTAWYA